MFLRFLDPTTNTLIFDLPLENFSLTYGLNQTTTWSASIPLNVEGITEVFRGMTVEFYYEGELKFEGILQEFTRDIVSNSGTLKITGRSFLDNLYSYKSVPYAYYDNKPVLGVMTEILLQADWGLGDIGTLEDVDQTVTKDLRGEKTLLTQLNKLLDGIPFTYWREGQTRLGTRTLDIGGFNRISQIGAITPDNMTQYDEDDPYLHTITSFQYSVDFVDAIYGVRVEGGNVNSSGAERVVNLGDAVALDNDLLYDPDYPIVEDVNETSWCMLNRVDYPYPGGRVVSTDNTPVTITGWCFGDAASGAVDNNRNFGFIFKPFPGRFRQFTVWLGTVDLTFTGEVGVNFNAHWLLYEMDTTDPGLIVAGPLIDQIIPPALFVTDNVLRFEPDVEFIFESEKHYAICFSIDGNPANDVCRCHFKLGNRQPSSTVFFGEILDSAMSTFLAPGANFLVSTAKVPLLEVVSDPIGTIFAGFTTEKQQKFAPPKTGSASPAAEIERAGYSAYQWGKQYLIEHPPIKKEYTMKVIGTPNFVPVGDQMYVKGRAYIENFDEYSGIVGVQPFEDIEGYLRVTGYGVNFSKESITIDYKLLSGEGIPVSDRLLALYDQTENDKPPEGALLNSPWGLLLDTIDVTISDVSPDSTFDDGTAGVIVTVSIFDGTVASLPTGTEWVYLAGNPYGTSPNGQLRIEVLEEPVFSSTGQVQFLVGFETRGWQFGDSADLTIKLIWR